MVFTPGATRAPLCAFIERGDRYTYPSLNLSSKSDQRVFACMELLPCHHILPLLHTTFESPTLLTLLGVVQGKKGDREIIVSKGSISGPKFDEEDVGLPMKGTPLFSWSQLISACMLRDY